MSRGLCGQRRYCRSNFQITGELGVVFIETPCGRGLSVLHAREGSRTFTVPQSRRATVFGSICGGWHEFWSLWQQSGGPHLEKKQSSKTVKSATVILGKTDTFQLQINSLFGIRCVSSRRLKPLKLNSCCFLMVLFVLVCLPFETLTVLLLPVCLIRDYCTLMNIWRETTADASMPRDG